MARVRRRANGFLRDFKEFALQGNVLDLAIAVIIGAAFGRIVTSFVEDVIMPFINPLVAVTGEDWRTITVGPGIRIGSFLGAIVDFIIITLIIFVAVRALQRFKRQEEVADEPPPPDPHLVAQERLTGALDRLTETLESHNTQVL
ncbi:MAG: large conductance mechanosensitive channel protein MscL [Trichormus sp. ATA11-4-KO1]|jgi:large conductance mechanosensitive channel|nr:large conductance mechanosensitive channel protein MscL [Trichormus sp. ATA11-4-KO1]